MDLNDTHVCLEAEAGPTRTVITSLSDSLSGSKCRRRQGSEYGAQMSRTHGRRRLNERIGVERGRLARSVLEEPDYMSPIRRETPEKLGYVEDTPIKDLVGRTMNNPIYLIDGVPEPAREGIAIVGSTEETTESAKRASTGRTDLRGQAEHKPEENAVRHRASFGVRPVRAGGDHSAQTHHSCMIMSWSC